MAGRVQMKTVFSVVLVLQLTELGSPDSNQLNRAGDEVFLPCKHTTDHTPPDCTSISWLFSAYENQRTVNLVTSGDVIDKNKYSLSKNCSLVMKEVREGDVGRYGCRRNPQNDYVIRLFVVNITEQTVEDVVILTCSVVTGEHCRLSHSPSWRGVDKDNEELKTSNGECWTEVTFKSTHFKNTPDKELWKCLVKVNDEEMVFIKRPSVGKKNKNTKETTSAWWQQPVWILVLAVVSLTVLSVPAVVLVVWKKRQVKKTHTVVTQAEPQEGVYYSSISLPSCGNRPVRGCDSSVTYSTVNVSSAATRASAGVQSALYANINLL
ncbi:uncharacterized protein LOC103381300 [Cynoglossus semilaevis]|uniref:uncharacterized protein LOC103381300 n=1 Tax=Cynoglossus semilaevis TaxID=244447 RepID=UPI0007DCA643|nr:uncharacterized protein LOC103381300 [Cynoglossus semilaevis]